MFLPRQPMDTAPKDRKILIEIPDKDYIVAEYQVWDWTGSEPLEMWETAPGQGWRCGRPSLLGWWELPNTIHAESLTIAEAVNRHMEAILPLCKINGFVVLGLAAYIQLQPDGSLSPESGLTATTNGKDLKAEERAFLIKKLHQVLDSLG